eukprot:scaffold263614_cov25-Tisochrysis_lutea.AAC.1
MSRPACSLPDWKGRRAGHRARAGRGRRASACCPRNHTRGSGRGSPRASGVLGACGRCGSSIRLALRTLPLASGDGGKAGRAAAKALMDVGEVNEPVPAPPPTRRRADGSLARETRHRGASAPDGRPTHLLPLASYGGI